MSDNIKFAVNKQVRQSIDFLYLRGYLDAHTAPELEKAIEDTLKRGQNKIIVNFNDLEYISSAGLGVFMAFIEDVRSNGGDIKLTAMKDKVYSVFDLLGFPMLFDIDKDEEVSLQKFFKKNG